MEPLHATVYEALSRHFAGINFCERNKGPMIDEHMRDEGKFIYNILFVDNISIISLFRF